MSLPNPNPADLSYPTPYFQDNAFVRGDQARNNNAFIFGNFDALDARAPSFMEYFTTELAAKANSVFYNGASLNRATYAALWTYVFSTKPEKTGQDSRYATTSSTSKTIAIGPSFSMTVGAGLSYIPGQRVRMWETGTPTNYVEGVITSYSGTTLVFTSDASGGSGTFSAWTFACQDRTLFGMGDGSSTLTVPDWRGLYLRGADTSSYFKTANGSFYSGGTTGGMKNDQLQGFEVNTSNLSSNSAGSTPSGLFAVGLASLYIEPGTFLLPVSDGTNGTPRIGNETRTAQVAVNFGMFYV